MAVKKQPMPGFMKPKTVRFMSKDCECKTLKKIAPMWFHCSKCGKIFQFVLSLQYTAAEATKHIGNIALGVAQQVKRIRKLEEGEAKRQMDYQKKAINLAKKAQKVKERMGGQVSPLDPTPKKPNGEVKK